MYQNLCSNLGGQYSSNDKVSVCVFPMRQKVGQTYEQTGGEPINPPQEIELPFTYASANQLLSPIPADQKSISPGERDRLLLFLRTGKPHVSEPLGGVQIERGNGG